MPNRLAQSTSPYLLQHANNPVDWYPWGEEAFAEARRRDVPIFLSIGYSTCYWCHVMERESFENAEIGKLLSDRFVCIKVDREERPDVDDLYMQATLAVRGQGGWPMTVFLEPRTLKPFWCGTYFPPSPRSGMPGLPQVVEGVMAAWRDKRAEVDAQAAAIADAVAEQLQGQPEARAIGASEISEAVGVLLRMYDRQHGGFGRAPKFPQPVFLDFLLDVRSQVGDQDTKDAIDLAVRHTLDRMAVGGLFDQVGGGFHRYSVDGHWTVPHFEKMLYDNAMLASVYAKAAKTYDDAFYRKITVRTLDYLAREMRGEQGGFFSAQDAEVDHREGLNYLWTPKDLNAALGDADGAWAGDMYGVNRGPNFQDPHHPGEPAKSVLRLDGRPEVAGIDEARLADVNLRLLNARGKRKQPHLDDKVLVGWNGLAISAFAAGFAMTHERAYLLSAERAAKFVSTELVTPDGDLRRSARDDAASGHGFFEDYAFVIRGLLDLADVSGADTSWRSIAARLSGRAKALFRDEATGIYYDTRADQPDLFVRARSVHDGAIPSASGVHLHNLLSLAAATGDQAWAREASDLLASMSGKVAESSVGAINSIRAAVRMLTDERFAQVYGAVLGGKDDVPDPEATTLVEMYAGVERIDIGPGKPGLFELRVKIAPGCHLIAAEPGESWEGVLTPMRIFAMDASGGPACVEVYAEYPEGEPYGMDGGPVRVYKGEFTMRVVVEAETEWKGRPLLGVEYQACSETACMKASRVELDVAIDRA
ncbi:MAG: DUF255 domain-containing protein [Tepidisphaera sp.]